MIERSGTWPTPRDPVDVDTDRHYSRMEAAEVRYEQRAAAAPSEEYQTEAELMVLTALLGGEDDLNLDFRGELVERFRKDCGKLSALLVLDEAEGFVYATPEHLERLVRWTVRDVIDAWVKHKVEEYAREAGL